MIRKSLVLCLLLIGIVMLSACGPSSGTTAHVQQQVVEKSVSSTAVAAPLSTTRSAAQTQQTTATLAHPTAIALHKMQDAAPTMIHTSQTTATESAKPLAHSNDTPPVTHATTQPTQAAAAAPVPLVPVGVAASGTTAVSRDSQGKAITYDPGNVIDGNPETAWRVAGDGAGQSITLVFAQPVRLSEVQLIPGYAKIDAADGTDRFMQNRRVKRATLEFTNGHVVEGQFVDTPSLQAVRFEPVVTSFVRITIEEATNPGATNGRDFTAISEVVALGQPCAASQCDSTGETIRTLLAGPPTDGFWSIVEGVDGDYARLHILPSTPGVDSVWSFVKRKGTTWEVVTAGTLFPPETLQKFGIPKSLWM